MAKRRDLLALAGLAPFGLPALLSAAPGTKLSNVTLPASQAKVQKHAFGNHAVYFSGPTDQLKFMEAGNLLLKSGMEPHPPHAHPEEEFLLVTEGTGAIMVDGKTTQVGPGSMMYCAANKSHHIKNTGKTSLLFYYYKWQA
ncbi:MAG: cupin domain-containing protein [Bryobacterales bacterium]|nr:cupin domain-containing protein [Bryobacterales bacterium]